jgi:hypothetical protein
MELISSCSMLVEMLCAEDRQTYPGEDFFALKLVQFRRRLFEVETRFVTRSGHVCAVV